MYRLAVLMALASCGTTDDDRPQTLENITMTILAPSCGNAQCHSSFRQEAGFAFDTVEAAEESIEDGDLVNPGDADGSLLHNVLVRNVDRMPWDQPLAKPDIGLIRAWIDNGAAGIGE